MTAILAAFKRELSAITGGMKELKKDTWNRTRFQVSGMLEASPVIVAATGIGKTLSAMVTQRIIDIYKPGAVIFAGIAGSLDPALSPGDVVLAEETAFWDVDVTGAGFKPGEVPFTGLRYVKADVKLLQAASQTKIPGVTVKKGRVLTGDSFITEKNRVCFEQARVGLGGCAVDMEGASAALVAAINAVPFLLIRVISDNTDGKMPRNMSAFLKKASETCLRIIKEILKRA